MFGTMKGLDLVASHRLLLERVGILNELFFTERSTQKRDVEPK